MSQELPTYKYYSAISQLPLIRYKDALIRGNLSALVIVGFPPQNELEAAWNDIQEQYAGATGNAEHVNYIRLLREIAVLNTSYSQVQIAVQQLGAIIPIYLETNDQDYIGMINAYRDALIQLVDASFDFTNPETYESNLKRCLNRGKGINKIELDLKELTFQAVKEKLESQKPVDDEYFDSILISLSDHAGYHLTDSITVYEFCNRLVRAQKKPTKSK